MDECYRYAFWQYLLLVSAAVFLAEGIVGVFRLVRKRMSRR